MVPIYLTFCKRNLELKILGTWTFQDLVRAQEDRPRCPSSCEKTMNKGHRVDSSMDNTISKVSPIKATMNVDTIARDSFAKTNTVDEEGAGVDRYCLSLDQS